MIITGASKGLGRAAAIWFSKKGFSLALISRFSKNLEQVRKKCFNPNNHICIDLDLLNLKEIEKSINKAVNFLKGIDVVLHAAGGGMGKKDDLISFEDFQKLLNLNILSAVEINRIIIPRMKKNLSGNIVHVGSIASYEGVGSIGYNSSKAALAAYVRTLGRTLNRYKIIMTGILPGGFIAHENAMHRLRTKNKKIYNDFIKQRLPRKKMGTALELLPMIDLLCSSDASMMGGCLIPMDAGESKSYFYF